MFRIEPDHLRLVVIFRRGGKLLSSYVHDILEPADFAKAVADAVNTFRGDNPGIDLLDVNIIFDKVD